MADAYDVIVVGAGAAGLLAATRAAERGRRTLLLEKNRRPGVKILMSGGTRCNITHATDRRGIVAAFGEQGPFLHSALAALGPDELVATLESEGVATKVEETGKVFPVSDRATDVLAALMRMLKRSGAELALDEPATSIDRDGQRYIASTPRRSIQADKLIVTVGGQSYPGSGTTGDGYAWAKRLGHKIVPPRPALAPLTSNEPWINHLRGVTISDVIVALHSSEPCRPDPGEPVATRRGSFLFTHFGLSGPAPMDVSGALTARPHAGGWRLACDFVPSVSENEILNRLAADAAQAGKKGVLNLAAQWVPRRLGEALMTRVQIPLDRRAAELSRAERTSLVNVLKCTSIPVTGTLGFKKAEVTAGGVPRDEIDSSTMESKAAPGLHFAGEIIDVDGPIGGYNFQAAFSTGYLAGEKV